MTAGPRPGSRSPSSAQIGIRSRRPASRRPATAPAPLPASSVARETCPCWPGGPAARRPDHYTGASPDLVAASQSGVRRKACELDELVRSPVERAAANVVARCRAACRSPARLESVDEAPLRAQLFTAEEMEQHGRHLAAGHELTRRRSRDRLLRRLGDNEKVLVDTCALLAQSADQQRRVTPAGEWLLDNFYLIEEEVRTAKRHLPPGYSRELPRIASGRERRSAARLRPRAARGRPRRQPARSRLADALHRLVPDGQDAAARRAVGGADHAAPGADREPAARRGAGRGEPGGARSGGAVGRPHDRRRRARPEEPDPRRGRHGALGRRR